MTTDDSAARLARIEARAKLQGERDSRICELLWEADPGDWEAEDGGGAPPPSWQEMRAEPETYRWAMLDVLELAGRLKRLQPAEVEELVRLLAEGRAANA